MLRALLPLVVALGSAVSACTGPTDAGADGGAGDVDAGIPPDGGAPSDGGPPPVLDAGAEPDAGPPVDGGASLDGGPAPVDDGGPPYEGTYYDGIGSDLDDEALRNALMALLEATHDPLPYDELYAAYLVTDGSIGACPGIFDYYSDSCWSVDDACGQYDSEGDCYNREHSWPKSWWGGQESGPRYTDLVHVIPADGFVNNRRGNLPLGEVTVAAYTSGNGSRIGACAQVEAEGECFEPIPSLKGDFARIYFYMSVRYAGDFTCCDLPAVDGASLKPWTESLLRAWHALDPVDSQERARNEAVFELQGNRNPFVDLPTFVDRISDF